MDDEKKWTWRDWENAVDQQIREAMERGEFDHLPGTGKPLDLSENPYPPADLQLAFKLLKDAGVAPDWIEQDKEIRAELEALAKWLTRHIERQHARAAKMNTLALDKMIAERERLAIEREKICATYRDRAIVLNRVIDTFNLKMQNGQLHHARIRIEEELERFAEACR